MEPRSTTDPPIDVEAFRRFERDGWDRVAHLYDTVWAPLTTQFVAPLHDAARIAVAPGAQHRRQLVEVSIHGRARCSGSERLGGNLRLG